MNHKDTDSRSRINKFEKRRKNTKAITGFVGLGSVLLIVLLIVTFGGGNKDQETENDNNHDMIGNNSEEDSKEDEPSDVESTQSDDSNDYEKENETNENDLNDLNMDEENPKQDVSSDDDNVTDAFTRNWDPIGTDQSEPHVVQFDDETEDRIEIEQATRLATELDDIITWWLGNNGDQKVVATVSSIDQTENYRVYLSWITDEGWQPTKVERLEINDKHPDYIDEQEEAD